MNNIDSIKAYKDLIIRLNEADEEPAVTPPAEEPAVAPPEETPAAKPEPDEIEQEKDDKEIEDILTSPKSETKKISVVTLASDLGLENPDIFKSAFKQLRKGDLPADEDEMRELGDAFFKIITADASTTQRVINRLRSIYRKSSSPSA